MRAAIYARVSTKAQDDAIQLADLQGFVARWGWDPVVYEDKLTGKEGIRRPGLERLLTDARQKKIDVVLCWKLDRFGRSVKDLCDNIATLDQCGVRFLVPQQGIDTDKSSPVGRFTIHILAAVAELERSFIVERTSAGREAYMAAFEAGQVGRSRHSRSGRDLPVGRPLRIFHRDKARALRASGMSWRALSAKLGVPVSTLRAAVDLPLAA